MSNTKIGRDADYRIAALTNAVNRVGQDGGIEGNLDPLEFANVYYQWLTGKDDLKDPLLEKVKKEK